VKELKKALKYLESIGFRITYNDGSRIKVYPNNKDLPLYSLHFGGDAAKFPFFRFAKKNWNINLDEKI
jgi:hypothetical protein